MSFIPYLFFDGSCSDAIDFYAEVFGAENVIKMPYSDAPPEAGLPDLDRLMHSQIDVGGQTLMCSDVPPGSPDPVQTGSAVSHMCDNIDDARATFWKLSEGGEITMPFEPTFFSAGFGMCKDKFGTHWMIMVNDQP